ncbi:MAG: putative transposase [Saprospiraceae bacterium]|jgi:putative transposase
MNGYKIVNQNHIHFITPTIVGWLDVFSRKIYRDIILESLAYCRREKGLGIHAYVIMTNHLHLVVSAKEGFRLSDIIRDFKSYTAKRIIEEMLHNPTESRQEWMLRLLKYFAKHNNRNKTHQLWQQHNHPVELVSKIWIGRKIEYVHDNPVRASLVRRQEDYIHSSASNYLGLQSELEIDVLDMNLLS